MEDRAYEIVRKNVEYLKTLQVRDSSSFDYGAILDPVLGKVIGDNYATEEFALASSCLNENDLDLESIKLAMDFHVRTTDGYPFGEHSEHRQHRRIGFIEAHRRLKGKVSTEESKRWRSCIKRWRPSTPHRNCNWLAMDALLDALIFRETLNPLFLLHSWLELYRVRKFQLADGFFADNFDSRTRASVDPPYCPIAYHAYTCALLHRYWQLTGNRYAKDAFLRGAEIVLWLTPESGHYAFRGRSAGHIFTYGVGYYLMEAAARETRDPRYRAAAKAILDAVERLQDEQGRFPLVPNPEAYDGKHPIQEPYAYHSVYNAHCSAWLARALGVMDDSIAIGPLPHGTRVYSEAGLVAVRNENYTCIVSSGQGGTNDSALAICSLDVGWIQLASMPTWQDAADFLSAGHVVRLLRNDEVLCTTVGQQGSLKVSRDAAQTRVVGQARIIGESETKLDLARTLVFSDSFIQILDRIIVYGATEGDYVEVQFSLPLSSEHIPFQIGLHGHTIIANSQGRGIRLLSDSDEWQMKPELTWSLFGCAYRVSILKHVDQASEVELNYDLHFDDA